MTREEVEKMIIKCKYEAAYNYKHGNIEEGKKAEHNLKFFKDLIKYYD